MRWMIGLGLMTMGASVFAGPDCTKVNKSEWLDKTAFQQSLKDEGYKIKVFKETDGNCYEIYGWNKEGKKVEIYFDPTNGEVVKEEIDD